jgi:hypothetical protein
MPCRVEKSEMVLVRMVSAALLAALALGAGTGFAVADPPPWAHARHYRSAAPARESAVSGTIVGIDYGTASLVVATPRGIVPVAVTPSTSIFRGSAFASFADFTRGAHVDIDVASVGGRLIAQVIRIR